MPALTLLLVASGCGGDADDTSTPVGVAETTAESETDGGSTVAAPGDDPDQAEVVPWDQAELSLVPVAELDQPIGLAARPGSDDLWVLERAGRVRLIERTVDGETEEFTLADTPVVDLSGQVGTEGEGGLLGLTFSGDGGHLYLHYTDQGGGTVVSELEMGATTADLTSERVLLQVDQPYSNHNGGDLKFGPDGYLYIALGDGGAGGDPHGHGQDTTTLLGTILRIDPTPSTDAAYTIPPDNPFAGGDGPEREEIWLWGARNPWRFSFDSATGDLWIGDVGQNVVEELDYLPASPDGAGRGANLGWNLMEGDDLFEGAASPPVDHAAPIHTYRHDDGGCSVTGGYVYRGSAIPTLDGVYVFSDYCTGEVTGLERQADGSVTTAPLRLDRRPSEVISFGQGPDNELYLMEQPGTLARVQPTSGG